MASHQIVLHGGPRNGQVWTVSTYHHIFKVALPPDSTADFSTTVPTSVPLRVGMYQARVISSTGHRCVDDMSRAIYDWVGEK